MTEQEKRVQTRLLLYQIKLGIERCKQDCEDILRDIEAMKKERTIVISVY